MAADKEQTFDNASFPNGTGGFFSCVENAFIPFSCLDCLTLLICFGFAHEAMSLL